MFEDIFEEIVRLCLDKDLITGKLVPTDSTHICTNARNDLYETVTVADEPSAYIKRLDNKAGEDGLLAEYYEERMNPKTSAEIHADMLNRGIQTYIS